MANLFGTNLTATGQPPGTVSLNHSRRRITTCQYSGVGTAGQDVIVFGYNKSSDIVSSIRVSVVDNSATTGTMDVGLYTADFSNGGTVLTAVDIDLFETTPFIINADIAYPGTEVIVEGNDVTLRALPLWSVAGQTSDPGVTYAICGTIAATIDSTIDMLVEIEYTAGD